MSVLGQLTVVGDDGVLLPAGELPRRARQVLGVLAARHGRIQSKDALADAVWGEDLPSNHAGALEHYVSVIRRRLQPAGPASAYFIVTFRGGYLFDTDRAELDLADLRNLVRGLDGLAPNSPERLRVNEQVLTLARGLPFPEDPYAEWAESVRTEVRIAAVNSLLKLSTHALPDDPLRSLRLAQEAIELNPFLESCYHAAMQAAVAMGRQDDALRIFERCRQVLDSELGVTPSAELTRLQRTLLAGRTAPDEMAALPLRPASAQEATPLAVAEALARPATVPVERFLGRVTELRLLLEPDQPPVVHIVGPSGAGKSAFLAELGRHTPGRIGIGHAGAAVGVLRSSWLHTALVQLGADPQALTAVANADPQQPLRPSDLELVGATFDRSEPVFLAVDDARDLDAASVAELAWLSRHCPALRIVLAYDYPSQLAGRPLEGLGTPVVMRLAPLTEQELAPLDDPSVLERTGGLPALVAAARHPEEVAVAVAMQIARRRTEWMPALAWEVLRLCAVLGDMAAGELAKLTGRAVPEVLACVDALVHAHLLGEQESGLVGHRSSLVRVAVAAQVSSASTLYLRERLTAAS